MSSLLILKLYSFNQWRAQCFAMRQTKNFDDPIALFDTPLKPKSKGVFLHGFKFKIEFKRFSLLEATLFFFQEKKGDEFVDESLGDDETLGNFIFGRYFIILLKELNE